MLTGEITSRLSADTTTVADQICLNLNVRLSLHARVIRSGKGFPTAFACDVLCVCIARSLAASSSRSSAAGCAALADTGSNGFGVYV